MRHLSKGGGSKASPGKTLTRSHKSDFEKKRNVIPSRKNTLGPNPTSPK